MGEITMENKTGGGKVVKVSGELTIEAAASLKRVLLEAYEGGQIVEVDVSRTESLDLACLQVLCASHRYFIKGGKTIVLTGGLQESLSKSIHDTAIDPSTCDSTCTSECLWGKGGSHA